MSDILNGAVVELARQIKTIADLAKANSQLDGEQNVHIQALYNRIHELEQRLTQEQQINVAIAHRLEALEKMLSYSRPEAH